MDAPAATRPRVDATGAARPGMERAGYSVSGGSRPIAGVGALALTGLLIGGFAFVNAGHHQARQLDRLNVFSVELTPPPPPPPPPAAPSQPRDDSPVVEVARPDPPVAVPHQAVLPPVPTMPVPVQAAPAPAPAPAVSAPVAAAAPAASPAPPAVANMDLAEKLISVRKPIYPMREKQAHVQGTVQLLVTVATSGRVQDIAVSKSSGSSALDQAALDAVRHWRWSPPMANGQPILARGVIPITFNLT